MSAIDGSLPLRNALLASLPAAEIAVVARRSQYVDLALAKSVYEYGDRIRHIYFPTGSYISLVTPSGAAESIEVGMVGSEGVLGLTVLLDVQTSPLRAIVQGAGGALRMTLAHFVKTVDELPMLRTRLNRYLFVLTSQMAQSAACNRSHVLDARLARWVLMTQDRAQSPSFQMTHKFLSYMLGVRRTGVTEAAGHLQDRGLIQYRRGHLTVVNRKELVAAACPCYSVLKQLYDDHLAKDIRKRRRASHAPVGKRTPR